jgi:hypothetical protein
MLAASRWRVRPQRLEGEEDDMTRMMEEDLEERVGGRRANIPPLDSDYIGRTGVSKKPYLYRKKVCTITENFEHLFTKFSRMQHYTCTFF